MVKKNYTRVLYYAIAAILFSLPIAAFAHQPRIVRDTQMVEVQHPNVSQAFYGKLAGTPQTFQFSTETELPFYMNILVPATDKGKKDVSATLYNENNKQYPLVTVGGTQGFWDSFHEEFAGDDYYKSTEYRATLQPGTYTIIVQSDHNNSLYSLAIGQQEIFPLNEIAKTFITLPQIKSFFFGKPAYSAFLTPFMAGPLLGLICILALGIGLWVWLRRRKTK